MLAVAPAFWLTGGGDVWLGAGFGALMTGGGGSILTRVAGSIVSRSSLVNGSRPVDLAAVFCARVAADEGSAGVAGIAGVVTICGLSETGSFVSWFAPAGWFLGADDELNVRGVAR